MNKVVYTDDVTVIEAQNLNELQDTAMDTVPKSTGGTFGGNIGISNSNGVANQDNLLALVLGNSTPKSQDGHSEGFIASYGNNGYYTAIQANDATANRQIKFPDASGTIALSELTLPKATRMLNGNHDLNNLKNDSDNGLYGITTGVANSPTNWATLLVIAGGAGVSQIVFNANQIYTRMYTGSPISWSAWFPYYPGKAFRIDNPWESLDTNKCSMYESDNFLYVNGNIVYFSIRFFMKVATTGNLSVLKLKTAYDAYKPIMYSLNNGGVYFAHKTWTPDGGIQVFFGTNVGNVGVGTGAVANQGYIVQGMYFIA